MSAAEGINIRDIIDNRLIETHFQPIISIRKKKTIGVEALARYTHASSGQSVPPPVLFQLAAEQGLTVELDRLCRITALQNFKSLAQKNPDLLLFLNIDTGIIDHGVVGSGHLMNSVETVGLNPQNIVIEIMESKVSQCDSLKRFIEIYKGYGFLMALDDLGLGHSNLDRIVHVKPNIIKLDRYLIQNLDQDYYKQEICKSLVNMSRKIGALVVAECVETMAEVVTCLELGIDIMQGYYFAHPRRMLDGTVHIFDDRTDRTALYYKELITEKISRDKLQWAACYAVIDSIIHEVSGVTASSFDGKLNKLIGKYPMLEYVYILDMTGLQVTETIGNMISGTACNRMFQPDRKGTDQSLKEYFLHIQAGWQRYTTEPYMSLATGNLCITNSTVFNNPDGERYILCVDFNPGFMRNHAAGDRKTKPYVCIDM